MKENKRRANLLTKEKVLEKLNFFENVRVEIGDIFHRIFDFHRRFEG